MNPVIMKDFPFLSSFRRYFLSLLLIALITAVFLALRDALDTTLIALLYLLPLGMITALWGLGPGITSALVTFLTLNYFFHPTLLHFHRSSTHGCCHFSGVSDCGYCH